MRAARDSSGEAYYVPSDMDYQTWSKEYIQKGLSAGDKTINGIPEHNKPIILENVDFSDKNMVQMCIRDRITISHRTEKTRISKFLAVFFMLFSEWKCVIF